MTDKVAYEETYRALVFGLRRKLEDKDVTISQLLTKIEHLEWSLRAERCMQQRVAQRNEARA